MVNMAPNMASPTTRLRTLAVRCWRSLPCCRLSPRQASRGLALESESRLDGSLSPESAPWCHAHPTEALRALRRQGGGIAVERSRPRRARRLASQRLARIDATIIIILRAPPGGAPAAAAGPSHMAAEGRLQRGPPSVKTRSRCTLAASTNLH